MYEVVGFGSIAVHGHTHGSRQAALSPIQSDLGDEQSSMSVPLTMSAASGSLLST